MVPSRLAQQGESGEGSITPPAGSKADEAPQETRRRSHDNPEGTASTKEHRVITFTCETGTTEEHTDFGQEFLGQWFNEDEGHSSIAEKLARGAQHDADV